MKNLYITTLLFCFTAFSAFAEELPVLMPIADPTFGTSLPVADDKFPEYLEKQGDFLGAILEWRRVIYTTTNKHTHERALLNIARLQSQVGLLEESMRTYENILADFPESTSKETILYELSRHADLIRNAEKGNKYRRALFELAPEGQAFAEAERHYIWALAVEGFDTFPTARNPQNAELVEKLSAHPVHNSHETEKATLLSLIPSAGHFYLGFNTWGFLMLMLNVSFFYALITSMQAKHWGYGFAFGTFAAFVYIAGMMHAGHLAETKAFNARIEMLQNLETLQPKDVEDFPLIKKEIHKTFLLAGNLK